MVVAGPGARPVFTGSRRTHLLPMVRSLAALSVVFVQATGFGLHFFPHDALARLVAGVLVFVGIGGPVSYLVAVRPAQKISLRTQQRMADQQAALTAQAEQHRFTASLQDGFDMAETEADAHAIVSRVLPLVHDGPAELLLADSSRAHLGRVAVSPSGTAGCSVATPAQCPAVRRGHTAEFDDSAALSACPRLAERGPGLAAVCVPVVILGAPMGVLHLTGPRDTFRIDDQRTRVEDVAVLAGARIGTLRATASTQLAATTDPLTGLLNRRSMADKLQQLAVTGQSYAIVFADLDSFKALNDTHGHATGDHALRLFSRTLTATLRDSEIVCRHGGEEFLVVLPTCTAEQAAPVVHRIREQLQIATSQAGAGTPVFTASFGLADSTYAADPVDVIALADAALLQAKKEGKDRLIIADRPAASPGSASRLDRGAAPGRRSGSLDTVVLGAGAE